jgi:hypothetical protein
MKGGGVHQSTPGPEVIQAAVELEGALRPKVAFEHFTVIADGLHGTRGPAG